MSDVYLTGSTALLAQLQSERAKVKALREALEKAEEFFERHVGTLYGYGHDIPMAAGATLAMRGIKAALAATSDPVEPEMPSDVHPTEGGQ